MSDDSGDSDAGPTTSTKIVEKGKKQPSALINSINQASGSTMVDLKSIHDNLKNMEDAKEKLMNYKSLKPAGRTASDSQKENFNIADLLALGEGANGEQTASQQKSSHKRSRHTQGDDSDSDAWEEVEGKLIKKPKFFKLLKKYEYDG